MFAATGLPSLVTVSGGCLIIQNHPAARRAISTGIPIAAIHFAVDEPVCSGSGDRRVHAGWSAASSGSSLTVSTIGLMGFFSPAGLICGAGGGGGGGSFSAAGGGGGS